jgi:ubiquinone/menaquinone biosynthesis C-methylase UbiE
MNTVLKNMWVRAMEHNHRNMMKLMEQDQNALFLDIGCDDGLVTTKLARAVGTKSICGVDINSVKFDEAKRRGVKCFQGDISEGLLFEDNRFDVVLANQVIEHVANIDVFLSEIFRVLKKGGYAIVSTENGSSWVNITAAVLGWQIFSLTNMSSKGLGVGNPFAMLRGKNDIASSWTHKTIFNYRGLKEIFELHGFMVENILGAGYFPLPSQVARIDVRHGHFLALKARKRG